MAKTTQELLDDIEGQLEDILAAGNITLLAVKQGAKDATAQAWDVHDPAFGAVTDAAQTDPTQSASMVALLKGILTILADVYDSATHSLRTS